jgi:hypothetical protein
MKKYLFCFFIILFIEGWIHSIVISQEIPFKQAIMVIQSAEKSLKSAKWECKIKFQLRIPRDKSLDPIDESILVDNELYAEYSVLYDCQKKIYIADGKSRLQWSEGSHPRLSNTFGFAYNGKEYFSWQRTKAGDQLPDENEYTIGSISKDMDQVQNVTSFFNTNGAYMGFGTGFPGQLVIQEENFYGSRFLSSVLTEWQSKGFPISIQKLSDKWLIEAKIVLPTTVERIIRIHLLPKSGIVVFFSRISQFQGKEYEEKRVEVTVIENEDKQVVPHIIRIIRPLDYLMDIYSFSSVKLNPSVQKENFQLLFPKGTYVEDFVAKKFYKVGDIIDEDKAISDFMTRHGLTGNVPHKSTHGNIVRIILITLGSLMILASIILYIIKKLKP